MNLILFDLYAGGHHGQYARTCVDYWHGRACRGACTSSCLSCL